MNRLFITCLSLFLLLPFPAFAEIKTVIHTVQQPFGGSQSPDDARTAGIARAKREALEKFGTYIESTTVVKDSRLDTDEILALTAGVTKAEVITQKNYTDGDAFGIEITVKVELDDTVLEKSLKRLIQDRNHLNDMKASRVREKELLAQIAKLEIQNKKKGKTKQRSEKLKKDFKYISQGLTAIVWIDKAIALWDREGNLSDPIKAIEYLTQAIRLDSTEARAYLNRGTAYAKLNRFDLAIADYDQAIQLDNKNQMAYNGRAFTYYLSNQFNSAVSAYNQVISLNPDDALAYVFRGMCYDKLNKLQEACSDFKVACNLGMCEELILAKEASFCK